MEKLTRRKGDDKINPKTLFKVIYAEIADSFINASVSHFVS